MANEETKTSGGVGLPAGSKIGKYEVRERIAIGGQAIVYKGYDAMLDRYVAIKQISTHLAEDPKFLERFRKEAQIIARLGSEQQSIVTIHELIENEKGLFIVMEYVVGHSLETVLNETNGPVEPKATLQILWRLAAGLHAVHSAGIVHRDIKPGNIIVGEGLRAKITDFGVAASVAGQTSMLLGTTKYMAPELFSGGTADARADLYSLGFIAYEMLVGRPKFNEIFADVVRDKHSEALRWMKWHGNPQVQAPPAHEVNSAVPEALSDIVARMIAKDPRERFQSMEALGRAIKAQFSPRAKAAAAAGGPGEKKHKHHRSHRPAVQGPQVLAEEESIGPLDEADQLEVTEAPATVPLPRGTMSLRAKLILAGVISASIIAIGVIAAIQWAQSEKSAMASAGRAFQSAQELYVAGHQDFNVEKLTAARKDFQSVAGKYRQAPYGRAATVAAALAEAHVGVLRENFQQAQKARDEAAKQMAQIKPSGDLAAWAGSAQSDLNEFESYFGNALRFTNEMKSAEDSLAAGNAKDARRILEERMASIQVANPALQQKREDFRRRLRLAELESGFSQRMAEADAAADQGNYDEAEAGQKAAGELLSGPDASVLPAERKEQLQATLAARRNVLGLRRSYQQSIDAAKKAPDKPAQLKALQEAMATRQELAAALKSDMAALEAAGKVLPAGQLQDSIQSLRAEIALADGNSKLQAGKHAEAIKAFEESLSYKKTDEAAAVLEQAKKVGQFQVLADQAKAAEDQGRLEEALAKYAAALALKPEDEALKAKKEDLGYRIALAEADRLAAQKKYDEAAAAYEKARQLKPDASADIEARLAALKQQQGYESLIAKGDQALKDGKFTQASGFFKQAKALRDGEEVRQRITLTQYSEMVSIGRSAMASADYKGAKAYFKQAQGIMNTPEVKKLIEEAEQKAGP